MSRSVIVSAVRTPFGKLGGGLADKEATELGAIAIRAALDRVDVRDDEVEYVIMGQVLQGGAGQAPARQAAIGAGLPIEVPADTINKVCASSVRAVQIADLMIRSGDHSVVVAGGMESMSNAPYILKKARFGYRLGDGALLDLMTHDGLISSFDRRHMVEQASFVSRELGISREDQDAWALRSHERAVAADGRGPVRGRDRCGRRAHGGREPEARHDTREAGRAEARVRSRGNDHSRERPRGQRRRRRARRHERGAREVARARDPRDDRRAGIRRGRVRLSGPDAGRRGEGRARQGGQEDRRRQARRGERGVLLGRGQLDAHARGRPGDA